MRYEGQKEYILDICGYRLALPVVEVAEGLHIASFVMLGAAEVTRWCAEQLAVRLRGRSFDYIVCPEAKVLPLAQSLCEKLGISEYIVLRKDVKSYMQNAVEADVKSITTAKVQRLVADGVYAQKLKDSRVLLLDDVVSTGGTFEAMRTMLEGLGAAVWGYAAALREGEGFPTDNLVYLAQLPVFEG